MEILSDDASIPPLESNIPPLNSDTYNNTIQFYGEGQALFGINILNLFLTVITLGLYYPWAKASRRRYLWSQLEVNGSRLSFNGTGNEMFKGFMILYGLILSYYVVMYMFQLGNISSTLIGILGIFYFLAVILLVPLAILGSYRYQVTKTSWKGIFMSFSGKRGEFFGLYYKNLFLTIFTFGIYYSWMRVNLYRYLISNTGIGDVKFGFDAKGEDFFFLNVKGIILTIISFYFYLPVYQKEIVEFFATHTSMERDGQMDYVDMKLSNGKAWETLFVNSLLTAITFGIYYSWAEINISRMYFNSLDLPDNISLDNIQQSEVYQSDGMDQILDAFDIDF